MSLLVVFAMRGASSLDSPVWPAPAVMDGGAPAGAWERDALYSDAAPIPAIPTSAAAPIAMMLARTAGAALIHRDLAEGGAAFNPNAVGAGSAAIWRGKSMVIVSGEYCACRR